MAKTKETKIVRAICDFKIQLDDNVMIYCQSVVLCKEAKKIHITCYCGKYRVATFLTSNITVSDELFDEEKFKRTGMAILS